MKKIGWTLFIVVISMIIVWDLVQLEILNKKISVLSAKIDTITKDTEVLFSPESAQKSYEITVDMWQIFEKELQDYKQRIKEGKQYYDEQKTSWNSILVDLKKSLQEYDKFISAEGEFWEKQLKNYDKLLARTEERFDVLGQVIEELKAAIVEIQNLRVTQATEEENKVVEKNTEGQKENSEPEFQQITPKIKGGSGEYKTYPDTERKEEKRGAKEEKIDGVRGKITGSGEYTTY